MEIAFFLLYYIFSSFAINFHRFFSFSEKTSCPDLEGQMFPQQISEQFRSISLCGRTGVVICPEICSDCGTNIAESKAAVLLLSSCNSIPNEWGSVKVTAHPKHADQKCSWELAAKFLQESSVSSLKCSPLFRKQVQVSRIICSQVENHRFWWYKWEQSCSFPVFRLLMIESSRFIDQWQQVGFIFARFLWKATVNTESTVRENVCICVQQLCSLGSVTFGSVFRCNRKRHPLGWQHQCHIHR